MGGVTVAPYSRQLGTSPTPADAASYTRVKGNGLRRKITGLAPGTYGLRACSVRADEESDFTPVITVVVK